MNQGLADSALALLFKRSTPAEPFFCLQYVRLAIERAYGLPPYGLYARLDKRAQYKMRERTARQFELALLSLRPNEPVIEPGDILFWPYAVKKGSLIRDYGHVGIAHYNTVQEQMYVCENTNSPLRQRKYGVRGALAYSPLDAVGKPKTVIRLPKDFFRGGGDGTGK